MTRNSFVRLLMTVTTFLASPLSLTAKSLNKRRIDKGIKVDAGKDRFDESISLHEGDIFYCKVSTKDTDGDLYIFESTRGKKEARHFTIILNKTNGGISWRENFYLKWATRLLLLKRETVFLGHE